MLCSVHFNELERVPVNHVYRHVDPIRNVMCAYCAHTRARGLAENIARIYNHTSE